MKIYLIKNSQPIGDFFVGKLPAETIFKTTEIIRREDKKGPETEHDNFIQRANNSERVKNITKFTMDPDALFPTPIIISVDIDSSQYTLEDIDDTLYSFEFNENTKIGSILDGQHRILGLENSNLKDKFELPIVLMFNLTLSEKAYVFTTVNGTQTKVPTSLIYDLFGIVDGRSPQKTCHILARTFNSDKESPFYNRLKMLGNKEGDLQFLSQGTFVKYLLKHLISKNPQDDLIKIKTEGLKALKPDDNKVLRHFFLENNDSMIYKILYNYFSAISKVFPDEWNNPKQYVITKAIGFGGFIRAFITIYKFGVDNGSLKEDFFHQHLLKAQKYFTLNNLSLSSENFKSGDAEENRLSKEILNGMELLFYKPKEAIK